MLHDIGFGNGFLKVTPEAHATKSETGKWNYAQFNLSKGDNEQMERQHTEWEKILTHQIFKELILQYTKNSHNLKTTTKNPKPFD